METRTTVRTVPARDYHAAVFVHVVHPAPLAMVPGGIALALTVCGFVLDHLVAFALGTTLLLGLAVWRRVRPRRAARVTEAA
jgi:hypothetical protein